ncbi:MAG: DNA-directed RNA polymerase subunit alpha [bacterium]|nr:DNA-directed RNA polymerase subunit alpha [bacterium]
MLSITLPQKPKCLKTSDNGGKFEILGCYPGYGTTLGNALRRVLLSSLEGAAVTSVKIKGASHEFSAISGVMEDMVQIILNLKKVRFKMNGNDPVKVSLKSKGEGKVTAKSIKCPGDIEVVNGDQIVATITDKKVELEMEMEVSKGLGYIPVEQQVRENKEIGVIAIDAIYTPLRRVNYIVEDMRVGKKTDFNKITMDIETDGSITPEEAFLKAIKILVDQFSALGEISKEEDKKAEVQKENKTEDAPKEEIKKEVEDPLKLKIDELKSLSSRTVNVLVENKIEKVKDIIKIKEEDLKELKGMGDKGIKEIKKAIGEFGLTLK